MELPADLWGVVERCMTPKERIKACGSADSLAAHTSRRPWLAIEVRSESGASIGKEQALLRQLQLEWWPICHSLCINLRQYHEAFTLTQAQIEHIELAAKALPLLNCLHIIGRENVSFTQSSIEGLLVSALARYAAVLTLQVKTGPKFPALPNLRHLALDLDFSALRWEQDSIALLSAISVLKGLTTLFLQSFAYHIIGLADLRECVHLRHIGVQGINFKDALIPPGCHLHVNNIPELFVDVTYHDYKGHMSTGLTVRHRSGIKWLHIHHSSWGYRRLHTWVPNMHSLRHLRVTLDREAVCDIHGPWNGFRLDLCFDPYTTPGLEVLELVVHGGFYISIDPWLPLKSLVLIAAGALEFSEWRNAPKTLLKEMYLHSGTAFLPRHEAVLQGSYAKESWAALLHQFVRQEQGRWTACMPATFLPRNLQECCCGACLGCLVRAGVPVDCEQGWTSDAFEEHQRQYWQRGAPKSRSP